MNDKLLHDIELERTALLKFNVRFDVKQVITRGIPVSRTAQASVFLSAKNQLYTLVTGQSPLLLGDVQKIIKRMGMQAERYLPPAGTSDYFDAVGRQKFREIFPGRATVSNDDISFYRTLAPYNPALVQIKEINTGVILQFDSDAHGSWRPVTHFSYRRIRTS